MSTQSNAMSESPMATQAVAPILISPGRRLYWSVRREIWEHRGVLIAPAVVGAFVIVAVLLGIMRGALHINMDMMVNGDRQPLHVVDLAYMPAMFAIMVVAFLASFMFCLGTLHGERRDRSVLFWKSLPVSDTTTVLAKAIIPFVIVPVFAMALIVATHLVILVILAVAHAANGQSASMAWTGIDLPRMWVGTLYHLVTIHVLWYAPIYAYLMMVSAWAKRAPLLWAILPPVVIGVVEKIAFNTDHVFRLIDDRLKGLSAGSMAGVNDTPVFWMAPMTPLRFLATPGLWIGLVVAALFLYTAVRLRRSQGVI
jgi:ABC-2 type transport system permease protein